MKDIKVVFMGTPMFSVPILESLINLYNVVLVVCQPDREKDKKGNIIVPPVKQLAINNGISVFQPIKIKDDFQKIIDYKPDIIVTCAYGQIIPKELIDYPKYGCINVHASLLPRGRGGAPIHWALINGDKTTGITIMYMNEFMDKGDIISSVETIITDTDYLDVLYDRLSYLGRDLLVETLPKIIHNDISPIKQDDNLVTFSYNITKADEKIDFNKSSREVFNLVRGLNSIPGAYTMFNNIRMKVYEVEIYNKKYDNKKNGEIVEICKEGIIVKTKDSSVVLKDIKLEGKNRLKTSVFLNGIDKNKLLGCVLE